MKIVSLEQTGFACPSQWEGYLDDGREIYIRYRYGVLRYDINGETAFSMSYGDPMAGVMHIDEVLKLTGLEMDFSEVASMKHAEEDQHKALVDWCDRLFKEWEEVGRPEGDPFVWDLRRRGIKIQGIDC